MIVRRIVLAVAATAAMALTGGAFHVAGIESGNADRASAACWQAVDAAIAAGGVDVTGNC